MHSLSVKCTAEKDVVTSTEIEKCLQTTQEIEDELSANHEDTLEEHSSKSSELIITMKAALTDQCASEKDEAVDIVTELLNAEHAQTVKDLTKENQDKVKEVIVQLQTVCAMEKADFK